MTDFRSLLTSLKDLEETIVEGKYGAHGDELDDAIDAAIESLGDEPTIEEIYSEVEDIVSNDDLGGLFITRGYKEAAALGAIAQALELPGLYKNGGNGRTFVTTEQDDANRFEQVGSASRSDAETLAQRGYLTAEKAEALNIDLPTAQDDIDAQGAAAADVGTDNETPADDSESSSDGIRLSDGSTFDAGNERSRTLASQRAGELLDRYRELMRKMNESAPSSLRGYLKEYGLFEAFLKEELTADERAELADVIDDLNTLISADGLLSSQNQELFRREIEDAPSAEELRTPEEDNDGAGDDAEDVPPEADATSDQSGDQDATVDPGEGPTAGSLEAFADSGKGGLANDGDETQAIEELQQFLTDYGFDPRGVDGKYGPGTINAVKEFQEVFNLTVDGDAGPQTIGQIVEFRNDMAELEELVAAGQSEEGANESVQFDFRRFINIAEGKLFEALDDAQRARAEELIAKYEPFIDTLPDTASQQIQQRITTLQGYIDAPAEEEPEAEPEADAEVGEAVYKEVTGSGQGRRYTTFDADGNEVSSGRGPGPDLPTREEWEAQQNTSDEAPGQFTVRERRGGQGGNRLFGYEVVSPEGEVVETFGRNERAEAEAEAERLNNELQNNAEEPQDDTEEPEDDAESADDTEGGDAEEPEQQGSADPASTGADTPADRFPPQVTDETTANSALDILRNDSGLLADVLEELSPTDQLVLQRLLRN